MTLRNITELLSNYTEIEVYQDRRTVFGDGTIEYIEELVFKSQVGNITKCEYFNHEVSYMKIVDGVLCIRLSKPIE